MADKIVIEGIDAYDGEYEFDASTLTNRELHTIKRLTGVRAGELEDAMRAADTDLLIAFAAIAINRAGKPVIEDVLWDAPIGLIRYVGEESDARPPDEATQGHEPETP